MGLCSSYRTGGGHHPYTRSCELPWSVASLQMLPIDPDALIVLNGQLLYDPDGMRLGPEVLARSLSLPSLKPVIPRVVHIGSSTYTPLPR